MFSLFQLNKFKSSIGEFLDDYSGLKDEVQKVMIEQAQKHILGAEKKKIADDIFIKALSLLKLKFSNKFILIIIDYLIKNAPSITQKVYDKLKAKINGITEGTNG